MIAPVNRLEGMWPDDHNPVDHKPVGQPSDGQCSDITREMYDQWLAENTQMIEELFPGFWDQIMELEPKYAKAKGQEYAKGSLKCSRFMRHIFELRGISHTEERTAASQIISMTDSSIPDPDRLIKSMNRWFRERELNKMINQPTSRQLITVAEIKQWAVEHKDRLAKVMANQNLGPIETIVKALCEKPNEFEDAFACCDFVFIKMNSLGASRDVVELAARKAGGLSSIKDCWKVAADVVNEYLTTGKVDYQSFDKAFPEIMNMTQKEAEAEFQRLKKLAGE